MLHEFFDLTADAKTRLAKKYDEYYLKAKEAQETGDRTHGAHWRRPICMAASDMARTLRITTRLASKERPADIRLVSSSTA